MFEMLNLPYGNRLSAFTAQKLKDRDTV